MHSSSYSDHGEVASSFFFSHNTAPFAHTVMMPPWEHQASALSSPSATPEETVTGSSTAAERSEQDMLPDDFSPHEHSVVCGRGNKCINAPGSQRLKIISSKFLQKYAHTKCKKSKAIIVADIIALIRSECPNGGQGAFVRFHQSHWWEVDELGARQKVTTVMRDGLHSMYKSSSKSKVAKRRTRKVLEHRRQESAVPTTSTSTTLKPVTLNSAIAKNYQKTQDMFQRTFLEQDILQESPLEPIALDAPSSAFFHQQEHDQQQPSATSSMHKASSSASRLLQDTMQRRRKLLGHLEQAERALEMFEPLEPQPTPSSTSTSSMYVPSTPSFNNNNNNNYNYTRRSKQQRDGISVVTPPAALRSSNMFVFCRRVKNDGEEQGYASSSCSSSLTGNDNDVATPAPFRAPFPASFDIDNIFD